MPRRLGMGVVAAAFVLAVLTGCFGGRGDLGDRQGEVVVVEGWAPVVDGDAAGMKARALADAQKKAVERVVGVFISARTRVAKAVTVDQNILADTEGYIRRYKVLSERREGGFYKTKIRALVLYKRVGRDLRSLGLMRPPAPPGDPKVVVLIATGRTWTEEREGRASGAVRRALLERGFSVVDRNDIMRYGGRKSTDTATALSVGAKLRADIVVKGEARAHELRGVRLGGFHSFRARVSLEAVKPDTAEVVARKVEEASGLDPVPDIAEAKALENAGMLAGEKLAEDLGKLLGGRVRVTLRVLGLGGLAEVQTLAEDLRLQPDIVGVTLSEFGKEGAELAVTTEDLAGDGLGAILLQMNKYNFRMRGVSPYLVEVAAG